MILAALTASLPAAQAAPKWAIVVHGGAGGIEPKDFPPQQEAAYRELLARVIESGAAVLKKGGTTGKRWGRVGDSPIIGAGTYASNSSCAVSATGAGEYFIRLTIAREICALVQYKGMSLQAAADEVVQKRLTALGGDGGIIAVTPDGQMAWSFNTTGMFRARTAQDQAVQVGLFKSDR